jgi:hypothetical protein
MCGNNPCIDCTTPSKIPTSSFAWIVTPTFNDKQSTTISQNPEWTLWTHCIYKVILLEAQERPKSHCPHPKHTSKPRDYTAAQTCSFKTLRKSNHKDIPSSCWTWLVSTLSPNTEPSCSSQQRLSCDHLRLSLSGSDSAVPCINLPVKKCFIQTNG